METLTVEVEMRAFMGGVIRKVSIPCAEFGPTTRPSVEAVLGLAFQYGQNELQPMPCYSVSVGDVIRWQGERWKVVPLGFERLDLPS